MVDDTSIKKDVIILRMNEEAYEVVDTIKLKIDKGQVIKWIGDCGYNFILSKNEGGIKWSD